MKTVYFLGAFTLMVAASACNNFRSDHPQAELSVAQGLTPIQISSYADSISKNLNKYQKTTSLIYQSGDQSFYVDEYVNEDKPVLYVEHNSSNGLSNKITKHYFFKNDSLVLVDENSQMADNGTSLFKASRTYVRNNTIFKNEERSASSLEGLQSQSFVDIPLTKLEVNDQDFKNNMQTLRDAIEGNDRFNMVFENITTYPDSRYIVLKSKIANNFTSNVLVKEKDFLIDSLLNNPMVFKDQKLKLNWVVEGNEAVYVPKY